ncbi:MAG: hypothetical protein Q4C98_09885 [Capnocytophaga sp.]|nr:hypothetical protein [Capnocytophaga sp.]
MKKIENIDEALLQDLVQMYIDQFGYSPIAAKICAYLKLDFTKEGVTFDQLQEALGVSKGSISLNLRSLIDKGAVLEFNKFDDRKTYFAYNQDYMTFWLKDYIRKLEKRLDILQRLQTSAIASHLECDKYLKKSELHQELLRKGIENFKETLSKVESI